MLNIRHLSILALGLVLLLAACGQPTPEVKPAPDGFVKLSIGLDSSSMTTEGITTLGAPYNPTDGSIAVQNVAVYVEKSDGTAVNFDYNSGTYTYNPNGTTLYITLTPESPNNAATVVLPDSFNPYSFESLGYDAASTPKVIAYDSLTQNVSTNSSVMVQLKSVLGAATLVPRFPTSTATPGATIDLMLVVMANGNADYPGDYLQVPMSDFTASYGPLTNATKVTSTDRGIRIKVAENCVSDVIVEGTANGLKEQGSNYVNGDVAFDNNANAPLSCTSSTGTVTADLEAPTVTLASYNATTGEVSGTANDNYGIGKIQILDGLALLASTKSSEQTGGVVPITITATGIGNEVTYSANLTLMPLGGITVTVFDQFGNESSTDETANPNFVYVDDTTDPNEDGSQTHPFDTIQEGVDAVATSGTVIVEPGSYPENVTISKSLKLVSTGGSGNTTIAGNQSGAEQGAVYVTAGVNNVQIGDVGYGFTIVGLNGNGASEKAAVYFKGNHDHITVKGNNIVAQGDAGLTTEYGLTVTNFIISNNTFSGKTFTGTEPSGNGSSTQFVPGNNVPRQLVVIGSGASGSGNPSNILFSNNVITGTAGGYNSGGEQGNNLVTIDADNSSVINNTFSGTTTRYGVSLRMRRPGATISGNTFDSSGLTATSGQLYLENNTLNASLINANTFDKGVWVASIAGGTVGLSIQGFVSAVPSGTTIHVLSGTYNEDLTISTDDLSLLGANADISANGGTRGTESIIEGNVFITDGVSGVVLNGFQIQDYEATPNANGSISAILLGNNTTATISHNRIIGAGVAGSRGITSKVSTVVDVDVLNNEISGHVSGIYTTVAATGTTWNIDGNLIQDNGAGIGCARLSTINNNTFTNNYEDIGICENNVTVTNNDFNTNATSIPYNSFNTGDDSTHVRDYTAVSPGTVDLTVILNASSGNTFPASASIKQTTAYGLIWDAIAD